MPSSSRRRTERFLSRIRITHFSPQMVATVATRTSVPLPSTSVGELSVLWPALLDDVDARHDLDAADEAGAHARREARARPSGRRRCGSGRRRVLVTARCARRRHGHGAPGSGSCPRPGRPGRSRRPASVLGPLTSYLRFRLDGLEGLDVLVKAADGLVGAVDGPANVADGGQAQPDGAATRRGEAGSGDRHSAGPRQRGRSAVELDRDGHVLVGDVFRDQRQGGRDRTHRGAGP